MLLHVNFISVRFMLSHASIPNEKVECARSCDSEEPCERKHLWRPESSHESPDGTQPVCSLNSGSTVFPSDIPPGARIS